VSEIELRPYEEGDEEAINQLFNRAFGSERRVEEWRWKFGSGEIKPIMLAWDGDELVAQYGGIPRRLRVDGRRLGGATIVDVIGTAPGRRSLRRRSAYVRACDAFIAHFAHGQFPICYGFPGRRALRLGLLAMGYGVSAPEPLTYLEREGDAPMARWRRLRYSARPLGEEGGAIDELWRRVAEQYPVAMIRDAAHVKARLEGHPKGVAYHTFVVRPRPFGPPVAYAAFRIDAPVLRWIDLLWDHRHPGALRLLADISTLLARQTECERQALWVHNDAVASRWLERIGFETRPEPDGLVMIVRTFDPSIPPEQISGRLYVTMADADLW